MKPQPPLDQVEIIRQAFGYINQFKSKTFVIKIDSVLINHAAFPALIKDLVLLHSMGIRIVLVPGASQRIDEILTTFKIDCRMVDGVRISAPEAIPFIKMAAFDVSNQVMTFLAENGQNAVVGNWVKARSIGVRDGIDFQSSGIVEKLQTETISNVLDEGLIPIFPNIGWNAKGKPYNISSNELAITIARELKASKLFFIGDRRGLSSSGYTIPDGLFINPEGTISQLTASEAAAFLDLNTGKKFNPELELVSLAVQACQSGVDRVHLIDGTMEGTILREIFSNRGPGTMIYGNQYENIRPIAFADIPDILKLMEPFVEQEIIVQRTAQDLEDRLDDFAVYDVDGTIHACAALHSYSSGQGEIAAVAVDEAYTNFGIGRKMVSYLLERAAKTGIKKVFVLTTQTSDWFSQLGFIKGTVDDLPTEKKTAYNKKRNSLVFVYAVPGVRRKGRVGVE